MGREMAGECKCGLMEAGIQINSIQYQENLLDLAWKCRMDEKLTMNL